jgi:hypothetical protein
MIAITIREYRENDWGEVEEMILNAENFGPSFLVDEKNVLLFVRRFQNLGRYSLSKIPPLDN